MQRNPENITFLPGTLLVATLLISTCVSAQEMAHQHHATGTGQSGADPHAQHRAMLMQPQPKPGASTTVQLHDRALLTQDGESVRLVSDIIGDRIVVMDFVYTTCTTVCPVLSAIFGQLQDRLGDRLGREVSLVSLSVDPGRDTPQRLKAYADRHQTREGWVWLTGNKTTVDQVLQGLGAYTPEFEDHPSMVLVGDGQSGRWVRFFGFPGPDQLLAEVDKLIDSRQPVSMHQ